MQIANTGLLLQGVGSLDKVAAGQLAEIEGSDHDQSAIVVTRLQIESRNCPPRLEFASPQSGIDKRNDLYPFL